MSRKNREKRRKARREKFGVWVAPKWGGDDVGEYDDTLTAAVIRQITPKRLPDRRWDVAVWSEGVMLDRVMVLDVTPGAAVLRAIDAWGLAFDDQVWGGLDLGTAAAHGDGWTAVAREALPLLLPLPLTKPTDGVSVAA